MKVLLAVDGSRYSKAAATLIQSLNLGNETQLTVLTVIPKPVFLGRRKLASLLRHPPSTATQVRKAEEEKASELLSRSSAPLAESGLKVDTMLRRGNPAEEIVKACQETIVDLVVVGLKGTSDAPEFLLGGVAHKVIKYAPCSVLVAKGEARAVTKALVPLDGSEHASATVDFLLSMPLPNSVEVFLTAVVQSYVAAFVGIPTLDMEANQRILAEIRQAEEEVAKGLLAEAAVKLRARGHKVTAMVSRGDP